MNKKFTAVFTKERITFILVWIVIIGGVFLTFNKQGKNERPLPAESRYGANILAKKYNLPVSTIIEINKYKIMTKNENGNTDWKKSIEKASVETGVPENVIASILVDRENFDNFHGNYGDQSGE